MPSTELRTQQTFILFKPQKDPASVITPWGWWGRREAPCRAESGRRQKREPPVCVCVRGWAQGCGLWGGENTEKIGGRGASNQGP